MKLWKIYFFRSVSNVVLLPCYAGSTVARLQHDTSTTWFQTLNLIQSNRTAVAKTKHNNKETVQETLKCILMHL